MKKTASNGHGFGTAPVFLAGISTILGAILFLRFGYAVGNIGLFGSLLLILLGHAITIPTGLALAEIATNLKVKGGGEYFIISRSFGKSIGGAIGLALCMSQIISVAFYMIAFAEAFTPLFPLIEETFPFIKMDVRMISLPFSVILFVFMFTKGANLGVKMLYIVVSILAVSLVLFFMGKGGEHAIANSSLENLTKTIDKPDSFFIVFAICFPGFTGMTAGVGLSGDLKNPGRSIPLGTMAATLVGMIIYTGVVVKLYLNATPEQLNNNQLIMSDIAIWGPIIPIGLGAACISSAIGSILIAPRTLQALAKDSIFPSGMINRKMSFGKGAENEPVNATIVVAVIALTFVALGDVNFVAQLISMFFMTTYGTLCLISFLEHFAGNPSYRPTFRSKWYLSLLGAILCIWVMFKMQPIYATLALLLLYLAYRGIREVHKENRDLSSIFKNVLFQTTRKLRLNIQNRDNTLSDVNWRPSVIAISCKTEQRLNAFNFLRWIAHYYGFGSYFHFIKGFLTKDTITHSKRQKDEFVRLIEATDSSVFIHTVVSPSFTSAIAQIIQIPSISGLENNTILLEFDIQDKTGLDDVITGCRLAETVNFNILVLRSHQHNFGYKQQIDVWITKKDFKNAGLMILLSYIIKGHDEWSKAKIKIYAAFEADVLEKEMLRLNYMIQEGRIPISTGNIIPVPYPDEGSFESMICEKSAQSDLVLVGFDYATMIEQNDKCFTRYPQIRDIVFVYAGEEITIN